MTAFLTVLRRALGIVGKRSCEVAAVVSRIHDADLGFEVFECLGAADVAEPVGLARSPSSRASTNAATTPNSDSPCRALADPPASC
jgi:hypothetical protein